MPRDVWPESWEGQALMAGKEPLEGPRQLAERYSRELRELVDLGELGAADAQRIRDRLFEPGGPGEAPVLKWSFWCAYVEEEQRLGQAEEQRNRPGWWER